MSTLLNSGADHNEIQETRRGTTMPANTQDSYSSEGKDELAKLALHQTKEYKASSPVSKQLAEIINKRWASKLKEKQAQGTEREIRSHNRNRKENENRRKPERRKKVIVSATKSMHPCHKNP